MSLTARHCGARVPAVVMTPHVPVLYADGSRSVLDLAVTGEFRDSPTRHTNGDPDARRENCDMHNGSGWGSIPWRMTTLSCRAA